MKGQGSTEREDQGVDERAVQKQKNIGRSKVSAETKDQGQSEGQYRNERLGVDEWDMRDLGFFCCHLMFMRDTKLVPLSFFFFLGH